MNALEFLETEKEARKTPLVLTGATHTLTYQEIFEHAFVTQTTASGTITFPPAATELAGKSVTVINAYAGSSYVNVAAGWGGQGTSYVKATVPEGGMVTASCDGTYWGVDGASAFGTA